MDAPDLKQTLAAVEATDSTVVCTLGAEARDVRGLEWADLAALSLAAERIDDGVASTFPIHLADAVEDLASRENSCCGSWLRSTPIRQGDVIRLEITTDNPDGLDVILSMTGWAQ